MGEEGAAAGEALLLPGRWGGRCTAALPRPRRSVSPPRLRNCAIERRSPLEGMEGLVLLLWWGGTPLGVRSARWGADCNEISDGGGWGVGCTGHAANWLDGVGREPGGAGERGAGGSGSQTEQTISEVPVDVRIASITL